MWHNPRWERVDARKVSPRPNVKRRVVLIAAVVAVSLLAGAVGVYLWFRGREYVIRIPEARIQAALDNRFPMERRHLLIFVVRYQNPRVKLEEGSDRIGAGVDAETLFKLNEKSLTGSADISGRLEFDPATGEFRLSGARIERLAIGHIPEEHTRLVHEVGTMLLQDRLDHHPVYRLNPLDVKQAIARLLLKKVVVRDGYVEATLGVGP